MPGPAKVPVETRTDRTSHRWQHRSIEDLRRALAGEPWQHESTNLHNRCERLHQAAGVPKGKHSEIGRPSPAIRGIGNFKISLTRRNRSLLHGHLTY